MLNRWTPVAGFGMMSLLRDKRAVSFYPWAACFFFGELCKTMEIAIYEKSLDLCLSYSFSFVDCATLARRGLLFQPSLYAQLFLERNSRI